MIYLSILLISLLITISLIPFSIRFAGRIRAFDIPDERKVHTEPIPRIGGIAIAAGVFVPMLLWVMEGSFLKSYVIGAAIIVLFGIIDDLKGLNYKVKFLGQIAAALVVVIYGGLKITYLGTLLPDNMLLPSWIAVPLTVVAIVGVTNAINLADGLDGLAGGVCLLSFCCTGYLAFLSDNSAATLLSISLIGAIFGFLRFNTYPASLFMGDTGSQFLGFSLVTTSLWLTKGETALSPVLPLIIIGFPILDTITVMIERIASGRSPFAPDKNHFHHRLMRLGLYHSEAVFAIYIIQSVFVVSAFFLRYHSEWTLLISYALFAGVIIGGFFIADKVSFTIKRYDIIDRAIKGRLKVLREKGLFIKVFFKTIENGIPLLFMVTCFLPGAVPRYFSFFSAALILLILLTWLFKKNWLRWFLTAALYLVIPVLIYLSMQSTQFFEGHPYVLFLYNAAYVFLLVFVILTLKFTRRQRGFKVTPMDFLVFFIALAAPYIAGTYTEYKQVGNLAAKTIMFFFSYEVLMGELRGKLGKLTLMTICTFAIIAVRGAFGW